MKSVFKYKLSVGSTSLALPLGSRVLSVKQQFGKMVMYVLVNSDPLAVTETKHFEVVVTGRNLDNKVSDMLYIDTVMLDSGAFVAHVFQY